jgi:NHLM bacteriocin system ABC transporter ATP-binding protein
MNESLPPQPPTRIAMDGRHPRLLDHRDHVLEVLRGHVDVFAVSMRADRAASPRRHLFRIESGDIILDLPEATGLSDSQLHFIAVGGPGTQAAMMPRRDLDAPDLVGRWIARLAKLIAGPHPSWEMPEAESGATSAMAPGERRRGPARGVVWIALAGGTARLMGREPDLATGFAPVPLTSGMWIEAGPSGCTVAGGDTMPDGDTLWRAVDQFHAGAVSCLRDGMALDVEREAERLTQRGEHELALTSGMFQRLSAIVRPRSGVPPAEAQSADALLAACQLVMEAINAPFVSAPRSGAGRSEFAEVVEIARASRLRVRRTLLRGAWWRQDVGALIAWHGEARQPVALLRGAQRRYAMIEPVSGRRHAVDRAVAMQLAPEAVTFYPALPAKPLNFRDIAAFAARQSRGNAGRIVLALVAMGLLSLIPPLIVQVVITSVIPRTELDQLVFCTLALAVTALGMAGIQTMQGIALLRLEGLIDWKLQAALIDRLLRLPASLFRDFTVGDFVDRAMGIDTARRIFTGRALRGMMAGLFAWFSIALMFYYDGKLAAVAILLTLVRAALIIATSAVRLYHETRHFDAQGRIGGFVLQLLAGIGKLRVSAATTRALAVWSKLFAVQKRHFIASQRTSNALGVFEVAFPTLATLTIFAMVTAFKSALLQDLGMFLAFFTAFGQSMGLIGAFAAGVSDALVAIPHLRRIRPLISTAAEVSDDRQPPGELSGAVEFSRLTFRYTAGGAPVLDNVSVRVAPGEYIAIVGPSGSGKSSLFRLLLGFEKPESGAVFLDGKSLDTLDISAVRRQFGVVLQNGKLATGSLYDNICGGVQLPLEQAWEAARLAGIEADIRAMPMGMHTAISEGVSTLSGGQRQRIMIARAVARRPRILLFDEATSALDNQSQAIVSASLGNLNVTRMVIAHRLSTVRQADRIIVLVDGKVVQSGSYTELSNTPGTFADFAQRQLL